MNNRLLKELAQIQRESAKETEVFLKLRDDSDLTSWIAFIKGPTGTPYENGVFKLTIQVGYNYPLEPPEVTFVTKVFHPNIHFKTGEICLDILKDKWSGAITLKTVCRYVIALLSSPEPSSPLNCDCGNLLRCGDVRGFNSMARMYTNLFATEKIDS